MFHQFQKHVHKVLKGEKPYEKEEKKDKFKTAILPFIFVALLSFLIGFCSYRIYKKYQINNKRKEIAENSVEELSDNINLYIKEEDKN